VTPLVSTVQLVPVLVVLRMTPALPTTYPVVPEVMYIPFRCWEVPLVCAVQVVPLERRIVPELPIANPALAPVKKAPFRFWEVPLVCAVQEVPVVVLRAVPASPTA